MAEFNYFTPAGLCPGSQGGPGLAAFARPGNHDNRDLLVFPQPLCDIWPCASRGHCVIIAQSGNAGWTRIASHFGTAFQNPVC